MGETSGEKRGIAELLEKIPPERCWEITAKILSANFVMRGEKIIAPTLGKGEGIISYIWGAEKWIEINLKVFGDGSKLLFPMFKDMFNIPVEDAIGAANLVIVTAALMMGPMLKSGIVEATPERVVSRWTKCPWLNRYNEFEVDLAFRASCEGHQVCWIEGLKAINPKLTYKLTKAMPWGDPYCEDIYEFKDE